MAGAIRSLIIGGGVRAGTPATLSAFPIFSGTTPPDILVDGNIRQDTNSPPQVFIGDALLTPGATVIGGATANVIAQKCIVIGDGASYLPAGHNSSGLVIGRGASAIGFGGATVVGPAASSTGPNGDTVVIGRGATSTVDSTVVIGATASCSVGAQSIAIGFGAVTAGNLYNIAIGRSAAVSGGAGTGSCVVVGANSSTNKPNSIILGTGTILAVGTGQCILIGNGVDVSGGGGISNAIVVGGVSHRITQFIIGTGSVQGTCDPVTFRLTDALGANIAAGGLTIRPGNSTGAGAQQSIIFQTQSAAGAASVLGTMTTQVSIVPSTGAAGQANLRFDNVTSGAGAAAGTLANAPTAGNPVFWLPVNIAGNIRYIPCWP